MKLLEKIKSLNKFVSFHIFSLSGWYELFVIVFIFYLEYTLRKQHPDWSSDSGVSWYFIALTGFYIWLLLATFISILFENAFKHEIKNKFFLNNKFYKFFVYIGFLLSLIFCLFLIFITINIIVS